MLLAIRVVHPGLPQVVLVRVGHLVLALVVLVVVPPLLPQVVHPGLLQEVLARVVHLVMALALLPDPMMKTTELPLAV